MAAMDDYLKLVQMHTHAALSKLLVIENLPPETLKKIKRIHIRMGQNVERIKILMRFYKKFFRIN
jgi:hypothetical protein